ncbi:hypothetical protein GGR53DRAFT_466992 [Hypoxylon sp. FL1150]|nr:hypothetical protein GGR53DRAFT_466992 [Hypoxylon sp. FL1150]
MQSTTEIIYSPLLRAPEHPAGGWARTYLLTWAPKNSTGDEEEEEEEEEVLTWATHNIQSFRFPLSATTPPGEDLVRAEGLALHAAREKDYGQFYVSCAQIEVIATAEAGGGEGEEEPGPLLPILEMYWYSDPGVLIPVFWSYLS